MTWLKFLARDAVGPFSGYAWPAPTAQGPGAWTEAQPPLDPCRNGIHVCRARDLPLWLHQELYTVEVDSPVIEHDTFALVHRARLVHRVEGWGPDSASRFSSDCAWHVRDSAATALRAAGRTQDADRLDACVTLTELRAAAVATADGEGGELAPYAADAATYAIASATDGSWAGPTATTAYVAARAARVAAPAGTGREALSAELARQARWLADHVLPRGSMS